MYEDFRETVIMCHEVHEGKEDRKRLLHAKEAIEWPFSMELNNLLSIRKALIGDYMLASVVTFCWTGPK